MNLRPLARAIDIEYGEAVALKWSLETYLRILLAQTNPVTAHQLLTVKPSTRVLTWLTRALLPGCWPKYGPKRYYARRPRKLRLDVDELLLLRELHRRGHLPDHGIGTQHRLDLCNVLAEIDQKACSLPAYFQL